MLVAPPIALGHISGRNYHLHHNMSSTSQHTDVNLPPKRRRRRWLVRGLFIMCFVLPVAYETAIYAAADKPPGSRQANWSTTGLLPSAASDPEARVIVFAARNGRWRSIFAVHSWIVVKPENGPYARYEVTGFGQPVRVNWMAPDAYWFSNRPEVVADIRGPLAAQAIPKITAAIDKYAYAKFGDYRVWPGPNSNTFVATALRAAPELHVALPPTAIGKDFRADYSVFGFTPSETGIEIAVFGLLGLKAGWVEGIELNMFTLVAGLDLRRPAVKLPAIGGIGLDAIDAGARATGIR
jgi:hypothetical protein